MSPSTKGEVLIAFKLPTFVIMSFSLFEVLVSKYYYILADNIVGLVLGYLNHENMNRKSRKQKHWALYSSAKVEN